MFESRFDEFAPAPVFVDQSGVRGRLLRGFGWPVSVVGAILAVAMGSSLIGVQADAPAMGIPAQPSRSPAPPPSPVRSLSPVASSVSPFQPSLRTARPSATARTKTAATTSKTAATTSEPSATTSRASTTAPQGARPSGRPAKHP